MMPNTMQIDDFPQIEEVLHITLDKFITFAKNDCGFIGSTHGLMVNQVPPLFLKAKSTASKEDNPNWWKVMNGPFSC